MRETKRLGSRGCKASAGAGGCVAEVGMGSAPSWSKGWSACQANATYLTACSGARGQNDVAVPGDQDPSRRAPRSDLIPFRRTMNCAQKRPSQCRRYHARPRRVRGPGRV